MSHSDEGPSTRRHIRRPRPVARAWPPEDDEIALSDILEKIPLTPTVGFEAAVDLAESCALDVAPQPATERPPRRTVNVAPQRVPDERPDSCIFRSLKKSPRPRPLDLADDFKIVEGVPTFTWADPVYWTSFHMFALSFDKTRMALVEEETKIRVYDILENFALIAESEECFVRVNCVAFPRTQKDAVVVVHDSSTISLLSVSIMDDSEYQRSRSKSLRYKLCVKNQHRVLSKSDSPETVFCLIARNAWKTWVLVYDSNATNEFTLCSISEKKSSETKILTQDDMRPRATFVSVSNRALIVVVESEINSKKKKTWIWKGIDFKEEVIQRRPIEIEGQVIGLSDCGEHFVVRRDEQGKEDVACLYGINALKEDSPQPFSSMLLPANTLDVKVKFFRDIRVEYSRAYSMRCECISVVAFLTTHRSKVSLTFWDRRRKRIIEQKSFTTTTMTWSTDSNLNFCFSPNLKWIVLEGWLNGRTSLFSVESGLLVWDTDLLDEELARAPYSTFEFDASSTKLIVNCSKKLYAFAPPCLIEDYQIELRCAKYELCVNAAYLLAPLTLEHQRLLSKESLKRLILGQLCLRAKQNIGYFDVAVSRTTSTTAILVWKKSTPLLLLGSINTFTSATLRNYLQHGNALSISLEDVCKTDESEFFTRMKISGWNPSVSLFLYPDRKRNEDLIVIFASTLTFSAAFQDPVSGETEYIHFSNEKCAHIRQSSDGYHVACAMHHEVLIINLTRRERRQLVKYEAVHCWRHYLHDSRALERASIDGDCTIVVGFDSVRKSVVYLTPELRDKDILSEIGLSESIAPCCTFRRDHLLVGYLEFNDLEKSPTALVITNYTSVTSKNKFRRILRKEEWNLHTRRVINALFNNHVVEYTLHFDERTGHLWIIGITEEASKSNVMFVPFGPFSLDNCVPCLHMEDYPTNIITATDIERLDIIRDDQ